MSAIRCLKTGVMYQNPRPHVRSIHAHFPWVVAMDNGELLATFQLGEAFEAVDKHAHLARSQDMGETWQLEGPIYPGTLDRLTTDLCRLTVFPGGELIAAMSRADRSEHPDEGPTNAENLGMVPIEFLVLRSQDYGHSWSEPELVDPPLVGPAFELCAPITPLRDGRWIWPTSTWRGWDGDLPNGLRMVAFVSHDQGRTWPEYMDVMRHPERPVIYWESKILELPDGRLLSVAWAYDEAAAADDPNQYTLSADGGQTWLPTRSTGLLGQTLTPFLLPDGRILCVYRRIDEPGLWANISRLEGEEWINESCKPLWGAGTAGLTRSSGSMVEKFQVLRFGAPCISGLPDGTIFVSFWCYEECLGIVRWFKLKVD